MGHARLVTSLASAVALAEARSCLAALADNTPDAGRSIRYERVLLELDQLHPEGPALVRVTGTTTELLVRLEVTIDRLRALGGDSLSLELLLADAFA